MSNGVEATEARPAERRLSAIPIESVAVVPRRREELFDFLASLQNHWLLADRWIEVVSLDRPPAAEAREPFDRGEVVIRGPLGVHRRASTRVLTANRPALLEGVADVGHGTRASVSWVLEEHPGGTRVRLSATVLEAGRLDRLLLGLGGRLWLRRRFARVLAAL
jgi:hypothetical protein